MCVYFLIINEKESLVVVIFFFNLSTVDIFIKVLLFIFVLCIITLSNEELFIILSNFLKKYTYLSSYSYIE